MPTEPKCACGADSNATLRCIRCGAAMCLDCTLASPDSTCKTCRATRGRPIGYPAAPPRGQHNPL